MIIDFTLPFTLETPYADLDFNAADGSGMKLVPEQCVAKYDIRSSKDNIPQQDGSILHRRFKTGYEVGLTVQLWSTQDQIACGEALASYAEALDGALSSLLNPPDQYGRLKWTPAGAGTFPGGRMFDDLRLLESPTPVQQAQGAMQVQFVLDTPFPYAIDQAERDIDVDGTVVITADGNSRYWPVVKVYAVGSPMTSFTLSNVDLGMSIQWDGAAVTVGEYVEVNMFNSTVFLNGDETNLIAGVDPTTSDFFWLEPGDNQIDTNQPSVWLVNGAWT